MTRNSKIVLTSLLLLGLASVTLGTLVVIADDDRDKPTVGNMRRELVNELSHSPSSQQDGISKPKTDEKADDQKSDADKETRRQGLMASVTIFVLAIFVGFEMITKVPPTLHTPLMSGSNAISGITIVGALLMTGPQGSFFSTLAGMLALALATINVVGGFWVTHRMLAMFQKKK